MTQARKWVNATLLIGLMLGGSALATTTAPPPDAAEIERIKQMRDWQSAAASSLIKQGSADALFTAAMLLQSQTPEFSGRDADQTTKLHELAKRRLDLLDLAAELDPHSAEIVSAAMHICRGLDACDIGTYAERLHQAEPDGAAWLMPALHTAIEQNHSATITKIVQQMGEASVFDNYYGASVQRIDRAVASTSLPPMPTITAEDLGELDHMDMTQPEAASFLANTYATINFTFVAFPRYTDLIQACNPAQPEFEARRSACRNIGMALTRASSILDNQIGLVLRRRAASDDAELAAVLAEIRTREWVMNAYIQTDQAADVRAHRQTMLKYGSEAKAMQAVVAAAGLPVTPPAGWVSQRALHDAEQAEQ